MLDKIGLNIFHVTVYLYNLFVLFYSFYTFYSVNQLSLDFLVSSPFIE